MKKLIIFTLMLVSFFLFTTAEETPVGIEIHKTSKTGTVSNRERAPMRVNLEAYYYAETNLIVISYDGEATGEVTVYHDGEIVASDTELNTVLSIDGTPGLYTIEVTTDSWTAVGDLKL